MRRISSRFWRLTGFAVTPKACAASMRLLHTGVRMNGKKIRRLMKNSVLSVRSAKQTVPANAEGDRTNNTAENLVKREFEMHGPRSVLLTDITYIPLNGAFCYLSTILDGCTKQVLSYVLSESLRWILCWKRYRKWYISMEFR